MYKYDINKTHANEYRHYNTMSGETAKLLATVNPSLRKARDIAGKLTKKITKKISMATGGYDNNIFSVLVPTSDGMIRSAVAVQVLALFVFAALFTSFMSSHVMMKNNGSTQHTASFFAYFGSIVSIGAAAVLVPLAGYNASRLLKHNDVVGYLAIAVIVVIVIGTLIGNSMWYQLTNGQENKDEKDEKDGKDEKDKKDKKGKND